MRFGRITSNLEVTKTNNRGSFAAFRMTTWEGRLWAVNRLLVTAMTWGTTRSALQSEAERDGDDLLHFRAGAVRRFFQHMIGGFAGMKFFPSMVACTVQSTPELPVQVSRAICCVNSPATTGSLQ